MDAGVSDTVVYLQYLALLMGKWWNTAKLGVAYFQTNSDGFLLSSFHHFRESRRVTSSNANTPCLISANGNLKILLYWIDPVPKKSKIYQTMYIVLSFFNIIPVGFFSCTYRYWFFVGFSITSLLRHNRRSQGDPGCCGCCSLGESWETATGVFCLTPDPIDREQSQKGC